MDGNSTLSAARQAVLPLGGPVGSAELREPRARTGRALATVGLFAGIGGIELGLGRAGHEARLLCEIMPTAQAVLEARFPSVRLHADVTKLRNLPREIELVAAGFPCQDLSQAGLTRGIEGSQSSLVGRVFELVERRRVPWLLLENVPFMLQLASGRALNVIIAELERLGYSWCYRVVDAQAFGRPQRRERVFLLASLHEDPREVLLSGDEPAASHEKKPLRTDTAYGFYWTEGLRGLGWAVDAVPTLKGGSTVGIPSPPAVLLPGGRLVKPAVEDAERLQGFRAGWTRPVADVDRATLRWKLIGNAVSVPVASWVGDRLAVPKPFVVPPSWCLSTGDRWPKTAWNVGAGRFGCHASTWPRREPQLPLASFLKYETTPLSERATRGFLERASRGSLTFPEGFLEAVHAHLEAESA